MISGNKLYLSSDKETLNDPFYRYVIENPIIYTRKNVTIFENYEKFIEQLQIDNDIYEAGASQQLSQRRASLANDIGLILLKYLSKKLHCGHTGKIFKGKHDVVEIIDHICEFIRCYILCPKCDLPELDIKLADSKYFSRKCKSCNYFDNIDVRY